MITDGAYIVAVSEADASYANIIGVINRKPEDPDGYCYRLRADTLEWELVEIPPAQDTDPTAEEILNIIMGVSE